jgi:hypothetical protein
MLHMENVAAQEGEPRSYMILEQDRQNDGQGNEDRHTVSSSTLAANGSASLTRKIVVDRTILDSRDAL